MNYVLAILGLCTYYIEYKKVKFKTINCNGQTIVKYFMNAKVFVVL